MSKQQNDTIKNEHEQAMNQLDQVVQDTKSEKLPLSDISVIDAVQCREKYDSSAISDYTKMYTDATETVTDWSSKVNKMIDALDPLIVFEIEVDGKLRNALISGHHRFKALKAAYKAIDPDHEFVGNQVARVKVIRGQNQELAAMYAVHCNSKFIGARMKREDYCKAVKNLKEANPSLSLRAIQVKLGGKISHGTIANIINKMKETGEMVEQDTEVVVTRSGREVKKSKKTGEKRGKKQMNGKWVPDEMVPIWRDSLIDSFVIGIQSFIKAISSGDKAHAHVPPNVIMELEKMQTVLTDSLPGNVCDDCGGAGCENCANSGYLPKRECYGTEPVKEAPKSRKKKEEEVEVDLVSDNEEPEATSDFDSSSDDPVFRSDNDYLYPENSDSEKEEELV